LAICSRLTTQHGLTNEKIYHHNYSGGAFGVWGDLYELIPENYCGMCFQPRFKSSQSILTDSPNGLYEKSGTSHTLSEMGAEIQRNQMIKRKFLYVCTDY
jgi:hypothetical protein